MKVFFKAALFVLASHFAMAQGIEIGAKGSFNLSNVSKFELADRLLPDFKLLPSGGGGVFVDFPLGNGLSFRPEVLYTEKGSKLANINLSGLTGNSGVGGVIGSLLSVDARIILRYIDVPLLLKYKFATTSNSGGYIVAGPSLGFKVGDDLKLNFLSSIPANIPLNLNYNKVEFSGNIGAGYEFPLSGKVKGFVEGRYQHGFTNILQDVGIIDLKTRNRGFGISAGVSMPIGK